MQPDFVILGNPPVKKNSRPIYVNRSTGRPFVGKNARLETAEEAALWQLRTQVSDIAEELPIAYPLHIKFLFYRGDKRAVDLSNLYEFPQDILQEAHIIANDAIIESHDGSRKLYDPENPRTEIFIEKYEERSPVLSEPQ